MNRLKRKAMEIRILKAVYDDLGDIRPVGKALEDENGNYKKCFECKEGILYLEFESAKIKCIKCCYQV